MTARLWLVVPLTLAVLLTLTGPSITPACCPAPPSGKPVVNADQTVIILWDAAMQTQHFIRKATFKSEADDFGFLVPTPSPPELEESGDAAFPFLLKITEPEVKQVKRPINVGCTCGGAALHQGAGVATDAPVRVLTDKEVAGYRAVVLEAKSADTLVAWLKGNGYAFSPEVEAWAKPYIAAGWKITALKVTKDPEAREKAAVAGAALRLSFRTERPLFPYREPASRAHAEALGAKERLLRIYFLAEARYRGELAGTPAWTGRVAWANRLKPEDRAQALALLKLPESAGPAEWWLTEFEDPWPYRVAPSDLSFVRDTDRTPVTRPPIIIYVRSARPPDVTALALAVAVVLPPVLRRVRRLPQQHGTPS